jgi:cation diffusion facilitator family transporter
MKQPSTTAKSARPRAVWWAAFGLLASSLLAILKLTAAAVTGSAAVLSDALESLINVVTSALTVRATMLSAKPRDDEHPYGHGKIEYVAAAVQAALVGSVGGATVAIAIPRLLAQDEVHNLDGAMLLVVAIGALTLAAGETLRRAGIRLGSMAVETDGLHLRSDAITTFGALIGLAIVRITGAVIVDALFAIAMGAWLLLTAFRMGRPAVAGLMDEADPALLGRIAAVLEKIRAPGWTAPHHTKTHRLGPDLHIDMHIVLPRFWSLSQAHDAAELIETGLNTEFGRAVDTMVHLEPCTPRACTECDLGDCPIRSSAFQRREPWDAIGIARRVRHEET